MDRVGAYAYLRFATDTADPARGALLQTVEERSTAIATELLFVELEWAARPRRAGGRAARRPRARPLAPLPRSGPPVPSAPALRTRGEGGRGEVGDRTLRLVPSLHPGHRRHLRRARRPDDAARGGLVAACTTRIAERRHAAGRAVTGALEPGLPVRTYIFNTILADQSIDDRLRAFPTWISSRNLSNEIDESTVEALVHSVTSRYDLPARWYRLKARLLGLDELTEHDRYAPLAARRARDRLGRGAADRARRVPIVLARDGRHRRRLLRPLHRRTRSRRASRAARSRIPPYPPRTRTSCSTSPPAGATS